MTEKITRTQTKRGDYFLSCLESEINVKSSFSAEKKNDTY